jgi:hypothetical protein
VNTPAPGPRRPSTPICPARSARSLTGPQDVQHGDYLAMKATGGVALANLT